MGFLWNEYSKEKYYYISTKSPYMETWDTLTDDVAVNISIRLDDIIIPKTIVDNEEKLKLLYKMENEGRYKDFFNFICHYVAQSDMIKGLNYTDIVGMAAERQINAGKYGAKAKKLYLLLNEDDKTKICRYLAKYQCSDFREVQLDAAIKNVFHEVIIYHEKSTDILHICIGKEKTEYNQKLFELICYFFADVGLKIEVYWEGEYFGIIGIDETMQLDSAALI